MSKSAGHPTTRLFNKRKVCLLSIMVFCSLLANGQAERHVRAGATPVVYTLSSTASYNAVALKGSVAEEGSGTIPVKVLSNPSRGAFRVFLKGNKQEKVTFSILDRHGRTIDKRIVSAGAELRFGYWYAPGTYFIDIARDGRHQKIRLEKLAE
jgi:hypothetical protein